MNCMLSHNTSSPYNKVISSGYHHRSQPHGMQPQLAPDAASEVVKPTDTLSPRRRVLGELSANSRRRTSPSSTKHIFNSLDSPVPSTSPVKVSLKSPILRSVTLPNQPAAHAVSAIDEAENQSSNVIKISNNNSKKRSIDQINSSASEQLRRSPVRHAPSVSVSLFQRGNELSNGKDADEPSGLIDAKTRTSHSSATDHDASTTTATTNYTPPVEALVKDETDSLDEKLGGRIATKKQAENLRLRLRVAMYKVRTNQTRVPLSNLRLEAQSIVPVATPSAPTLTPLSSSSSSKSASLSSPSSSEPPTYIPT